VSNPDSDDDVNVGHAAYLQRRLRDLAAERQVIARRLHELAVEMDAVMLELLDEEREPGAVRDM